MSILLVRGAGYIGSYVAVTLWQAGRKVALPYNFYTSVLSVFGIFSSVETLVVLRLKKS